MTNTNHYFLQITKNSDNTYQGCIHKGDLRDVIDLGELHLQPDSQITLKNDSLSLTQLVKFLIKHKNISTLRFLFDVQWQLAIGQYLFAQTFGKLETAQKNQLLCGDKTEVRVLYPDEHIARLPWGLLVDREIFLSTENWTVALAERIETNNVELPPFPKILFIAPQPTERANTEAQAHIDELQQLLLSPIAHTWEAFKTRAKSLQPEIIYYYGQSDSDSHSTDLLFSDNKQQLYKITIADFAQYSIS